MSEQQKRRGPKAKHPEGYKELHLKFSGLMLEHILHEVGEGSYQEYFDRLVRTDMQKRYNEEHLLAQRETSEQGGRSWAER